jgi:hypothetical protein
VVHNVLPPSRHFVTSSGKNQTPTFLDMTQATLKMMRPTILLCCLCIRYRGNVSTEPLPSNDKGIFTKPLSSNDKMIFIEPLPSDDKGGIHRQQSDLIGLLLFFQNKESSLETQIVLRLINVFFTFSLIFSILTLYHLLMPLKHWHAVA